MAGFTAHAGDRRPDKGIIAAAFDREVLFAKVGLGKLDAAFKQLVKQLMRFAQVAQMKFVGVLEAMMIVNMLFHHNAAGVRVADIEDQIHRDCRFLQGGGADFQLWQV